MSVISTLNTVADALKGMPVSQAVQILNLVRQDFLDVKPATNGFHAFIEKMGDIKGVECIEERRHNESLPAGSFAGLTATECIQRVLRERGNNPMSPKDIGAVATQSGSTLNPVGIANAVSTCKLVEKVSRGLYRLKETA